MVPPGDAPGTAAARYGPRLPPGSVAQDAAPAAELYPGLVNSDLELWDPAGGRLGIIQDFDLYLNHDPTGTLQDVAFADDKSLQVVG